tara:strand:- start:5 stop:133 length:129 start_codon:yes stop_codon:yes gene_type:complete
MNDLNNIMVIKIDINIDKNVSLKNKLLEDLLKPYFSSILNVL